jgi:hypothetical protein
MWEICVSRKDEVEGSCRKIHTEYLHNLYSSPSFIMAIKKDEMERT